MPSATASGADSSSGSARSREHNSGNQDRKYTPEQKAAVLRVRRCSPTAFYEILAVEKTATDGEIKKAYRKLSLLTHPDKNGYEGADEAFKMVSRAFQILSDADKKSRYDKFGGDPDNRFSASGAGAGAGPSGAGTPFSGFGGGFPQGRPGGAMFEEEISPEELFNRFFGGGGFGPMGGGGFGGPQFVFNMGGGPGFRVHQFGGPGVRRRPREANAHTQPASPGWASLTQLLPLILLFVFPLLSSLFSGGSTTPTGPSYRFDGPVSPHTMHRITPSLKLDYYINPRDVDDFSTRKFRDLDVRVEDEYVNKIRYECEEEVQERERRMQAAQGWLFPDVEKMKEARAMELKACRRFDDLKKRRRF
ncbi:ER associated DnaJ chaperone (Hlj1), putative [Talaromyces stipitatus ATCC 10500]|uniref:ER associated DnaJ chaperone (Hlj1), putative n=1 Tax=Talaromyces stipitatus (strain ATCC 10500 / CBS 375.48 / QM 6759 / NRRL 1006) TaxID=441959 RepID=B8LTX2_TALSN|nr:ER associated DnaJ chaperone (Hlj1), putative [Talaromyces stipitatus ATCC 10500]EED23802.1 ER associated DnaJ chaperone (Hlj1), putative [Talaromyces stipitatus ATCC 10500]